MNYPFVGSKQLVINDESKQISFTVWIQYPTLEQPSATAFGPYMLEVKPDATIQEGRYPLILVSHGNGGSPFAYRSITTYLAQHGYIVALIEHYGNNRNDNHLEYTLENLTLRPRHIGLTLDFLLSDPQFGAHIDAQRIGMVGHSMGGYTALAVAGGVPHTEQGEEIEVTADARIRTIVLFAPGTGWFFNSLRNVTIPILLMIGERDTFTPRWNADIVLWGVPDRSKVTLREVKNAGHFSFLTPFPPSMKSPDFLPSTDPEGFDREKFHKILPEEVLGFLEETIKG